MEQLVVRLGTDQQDPVYWAVWSSQSNDVIASGELPNASALESLTERTRLRKAIVLVPGADVRQCWVTLPPKSSRKILSAIPFMLEDDLAEDISQLFFAMGPKQGNQQAVAIVSDHQMEKWQLWMADAGIAIEQLLPDVLALPEPTENQWIALTLGEQLIVRQGSWQGIQGELQYTTSVLAFMAKTYSQPVQLNALSDTELSALPNVQQSVQHDELPPMGVLAKMATQSGFNLLQGRYKVRKEHNQVWQMWRIPAILLALVVVLSVGERAIELNSLKQQNAALSERIDTIVKRGFPNIGAYRDVRRKVEQEIQRLEQTSDGSSLLVMLSQLNPAFSSSKITPQMLRFDANRTELRIQAQGKDFNALETFKRGVKAAGFEVEEGAINNREDMVIGTLAIRGAS